MRNHGPTWLLVAACALILMGAAKCPPPAPQPTPTPPPGDCRTTGCPAGTSCVEGLPPGTFNCKGAPPPSCETTTCAPGYHCAEQEGGPVCIPDSPPPVSSACPKPLAPGAEVYLNNKRYGNGLDSTVRVHGDPAFCQMIHGVTVNDCHLEGWPTRAACEMELLGGCPVWQYSMDGETARAQCRQAPHPDASCDHWGDPVDRDDPQTPAFEGRPFACGAQRDPAGDPMAGFFVIGHGVASFRACRPDWTGCGPWVAGKDKP